MCDLKVLHDLLWRLNFSACNEVEDEGNLKMENVGGVFVVLGCGLFIAFIVAIIEFLVNVGKIAVEQKVIMRENQFINIYYLDPPNLSLIQNFHHFF